jgi:hypothetical protein
VRAVVLLALLLAGPAPAQQICWQTDYQQLKDRAATHDGRQRLAVNYCALKMMFDGGMRRGALSPAELRRCSAEMERITDALRATGDPAALTRLDDCASVLPVRR